tara:strand:- start:363 stop:674 length:312 start_codon:yes stop_codon:yes gene_type:complete
MSETEHFKGKLKPTGKDITTYVEGHKIPEYYEDEKEYFDDHLCEHAVNIAGQVYEIERAEYENHDDIFESSINADGSIDFQVRYYNGGIGFSEALDYAIKNKR